jgi:hypothetical protein
MGASRADGSAPVFFCNAQEVAKTQSSETNSACQRKAGLVMLTLT